MNKADCEEIATERRWFYFTTRSNLELLPEKKGHGTIQGSLREGERGGVGGVVRWRVLLNCGSTK